MNEPTQYREHEAVRGLREAGAPLLLLLLLLSILVELWLAFVQKSP